MLPDRLLLMRQKLDKNAKILKFKRQLFERFSNSVTRHFWKKIKNQNVFLFRLHGSSEPFWIWVEDPVNNHIYHHELFLIAKKNVIKREKQELVFTIPIFEPLPSQYYVRAISDRWLGSETYCTMRFVYI